MFETKKYFELVFNPVELATSLYVKTEGVIFGVIFDFLPSEDRQKKKKQQKKKHPSEGKTSLQRSKTFVNLFFKKDRKEKSGSKSPSHRADKGVDAAPRMSVLPATHRLIVMLKQNLDWGARASCFYSRIRLYFCLTNISPPHTISCIHFV